jgi:putative ABC transport system permease protein
MLGRLPPFDVAQGWPIVGECAAVSLEALRRYKLRTALSTLGVILGISAVVAMMSVADGARREALRQVESMGLGNIVVRSRALPLSEARPGRNGLTLRDVEKLPSIVPLVRAVTTINAKQSMVAGPSAQRTAQLIGVGADFERVLGLRPAQGRWFSAALAEDRQRVVVLGEGLAETLFGDVNPVGQRTRIDGEWFQVIGVLRQNMAAQPGDQFQPPALGEAALVPLPAWFGKPLAFKVGERVDEIWVQTSEPTRVAEVAAVVRNAVLTLHDGVTDFDVIVPVELLARRFQTQRTFNIVVGSIAALSLLVGGIGIMNIMLASVIERTYEIGLRRTVGATSQWITFQFLIESVLMTTSGGAMGVVLGVAASFAISAIAGWPTHVSPVAIVLAVVVSVVVGLSFGVYPAMRAARLQPVEALRYE